MVIFKFYLVVKSLFLNGGLFKSIISLSLHFIFLNNDVMVSLQKFHQLVSFISAKVLICLRRCGCVIPTVWLSGFDIVELLGQI